MRWIFRIIGALVAVVVLAIAALFVIPTDRIAKIATDQFTAATGRALTIGGDVRPTIYPILGVRMQDVTLANADWASSTPMVRADALAVGVQLAPLFSGSVQIEEISAIGARVLLERRADGIGNWVFDGMARKEPQDTATSEGAPNLPSDFSLASAVLQDANLIWSDAVTGTEIALSDVDLTVMLPSLAGKASVDAGVSYNGERVTLKGQVSNIAGLLSGSVQPVDMALKAAGASVDLAGRVGLAPIAADVMLGVGVPNLAPLMRLAGTSAPSLPGGLGSNIRFDGQLIYANSGPGAVYLRDATARLAGNTLRLEADLTLSDIPNLTAKITAGDLNLSAFTTGGDNSEPAVTGTGWPRDRIDVSGLAALNARLTLAANSVDLGLAKLGAVDTVITLDDRRLVAFLNQVSAYGGGLSGQAVVNGRGGLSVGGDLKLSNIALQPLLVDLADQDRLVGTANGSLRYLAVGNSVYQLMQTLSGDGDIAIGQGEILGLDLAGMLRNLDASYRGEGSKTVFNGITASVSMAAGIATNPDLKLDAPLITATGAGTVNIAAQTLQYRFTPVALTGGSGISVPVIAEGPWNDLSFRPDLQALIDQNLAAEREAAEAAVRAQAEEALKRELGVDTQATDGNIEQAVRNRVDQQADQLRNQVEQQLQNELGNALRGLLGGN